MWGGLRMNNWTKSVLAGGILVVMFLVSLVMVYDNEYVGFCMGDESCVLELAFEINDSDLCLDSEDVDECYMDYAVVSGDSDVCLKSSVSNDCLNDFSANRIKMKISPKAIGTTICSLALARSKFSNAPPYRM